MNHEHSVVGTTVLVGCQGPPSVSLRLRIANYRNVQYESMDIDVSTARSSGPDREAVAVLAPYAPSPRATEPLERRGARTGGHWFVVDRGQL